MADTPKATEPARFSAVICHEICDGRQAKGPWHSSAQASQLDTRKHTEPRASGRHTGWWADDAPNPTSSALNVVRLNHSVPISWIPAAHQSIRRCRMRSNDPIPSRCGAATADGAEATSVYCRNEAVVKKI